MPLGLPAVLGTVTVAVGLGGSAEGVSLGSTDGFGVATWLALSSAPSAPPNTQCITRPTTPLATAATTASRTGRSNSLRGPRCRAGPGGGVLASGYCWSSAIAGLPSRVWLLVDRRAHILARSAPTRYYDR